MNMLNRTICVIVGIMTGFGAGIVLYDWKMAQHGVHLSNHLQLPYEVSMGIRIFFTLMLLGVCVLFIVKCPSDKEMEGK